MARGYAAAPCLRGLLDGAQPGQRKRKSRLLHRRVSHYDEAIGRGFGAPHLIAVYVAPEWRRQGIGTAVSLAVVSWARERQASTIVLSVSDWNDGARRVYESIGFARTGVTKSLPWNPSVMESEMRLELG